MTVMTVEYAEPKNRSIVTAQPVLNGNATRGAMATRVLVFIQDPMIRALVLMICNEPNLAVRSVSNEAQAYEAASSFVPELVVTDLMPSPGNTGLDFLVRVRSQQSRRVPAVMLTNHRSPYLVQENPPPLQDCSYIVMADVDSPETIKLAIQRAASGKPAVRINRDESVPSVTRNQAVTLRLLASGLNNEQIAIARNRSCRAVELTLTRLYRSLGVERHSTVNPRVAVTVMYHQSGVTVR